MKRTNIIIIIIFLLKRQQMVQSYCNQIVLQNPTDNTPISLQMMKLLEHSVHLQLAFWLYYSPQFITSSNGLTELLIIHQHCDQGSTVTSDSMASYVNYQL